MINPICPAVRMSERVELVVEANGEALVSLHSTLYTTKGRSADGTTTLCAGWLIDDTEQKGRAYQKEMCQTNGGSIAVME
jgi:hypothetical protein